MSITSSSVGFGQHETSSARSPRCRRSGRSDRIPTSAANWQSFTASAIFGPLVYRSTANHLREGRLECGSGGVLRPARRDPRARWRSNSTVRAIFFGAARSWSPRLAGGHVDPRPRRHRGDADERRRADPTTPRSSTSMASSSPVALPPTSQSTRTRPSGWPTWKPRASAVMATPMARAHRPSRR